MDTKDDKIIGINTIDNAIYNNNNNNIVDVIKTLGYKTIDNLLDKYNDNKYILNKINNYIRNLPIYIENDNNNYKKRLEQQDRVVELTKDFVEDYINTNNYYYCSTSEIYFKYDSSNYFTYREDTILYEIGNSIKRNEILVNYKYKIKNTIIKEIKDRNIFDSIPDTYTIQLVINNMMPLFLNNKIYVKYFLIILGDIIQKKNEQYTYLIDSTFKRFIKLLSELAYQYFGSNNFTSIKYGYHEIQKNCRIIYADKNIFSNRYNNIIENLINNLNCKNSNNFLDVFIVGLYYSNRYENSDLFLSSHDCENTIYEDVLLIDNNNLIDKFIDTTLVKVNIDENENIKVTNISNRNMHYLWKQFLIDNNFPNINFSNNFKTILKSKIEYNQENDIYTGVTSKKLPLIGNFLDFWENTINYNSEKNIDTNLEISEIIYLFKHWMTLNNNVQHNYSINESIIINLITHFFENVVIEEDKFIYNISCKLWDKNNNIVNFFKYFKNEYIVTNKIKKKPINTNNLYTYYCKWCKNIQYNFVVGKCYFNKFIITNLDGYIRDNHISNNLFVDIDYFLTI